MTIGVWKPVKIEHYTSRISDVRIDANVAEDLSASVEVTISLVYSLQPIIFSQSCC